MHKLIIIFALSMIYIQFASCNQRRQSIAIIGGGIGGAFLQTYLREQFDDSIDIVVYEEQNKLGGRCRSFKYEGKSYELGKQRFTGYDSLLMDFVNKANVTVNKNQISLGIYNEDGYVFELKELILFRPIVFMLHYPISSALFLIDYSQNWEKMNQIYQLVEDKKYTNFRDLLVEGRIDDLIDYSFDDFVKGSKYFISSSFIQSYVRSLNVLVFDQTETVNAFSGYASSFISAGTIHQVDQGLEQMSNNLFNLKLKNQNKIKVHLNTNVTKIEKLNMNNKYQSYKNNTNSHNQSDNNSHNQKDYNSQMFRVHFNDTHRDFDQVIIAFPLEQLENPKDFFSNFTEIEGAFIDKIRNSLYKSHTVTYVKAIKPQSSYFGLNFTSTYPDLLVPQDQAMQKDFYKVFRVCDKCNKDQSSLFEITSSSVISKETINKMFGHSSEIIQQKQWKYLYPEIRKFDTEDILDYQLSKDLYYLHAAEQIAPLLSMEAISAKIIANLMNPALETSSKSDKNQDL